MAVILVHYGLILLLLLNCVQQGTWAQSLGLGHACTDPNTYSWMYNAQGQSPCEIAVDLVYVCTQDQAGSTLLNIPCVCNTVTYSLSNACRICSGVDQSKLPSFGDYASSFDCSSTVSGSFPEPVPSDTSIPAWAFLNPTSDGNFDLKDAQALADGPALAPDSHITSTNPIQGPTSTLEGDQGSTSTLTGDFHNSAGNPPASGSPDLASSSPGQGSATLTITGPLSSSDVITTGSAVGDRSSSRPTSGGATQSSGGSTTIVNWKTATATWTLQENGTVTSSVTQTQTQSSTASGSSRKTRLTNAVIAGTVSAGVIAFLAAGIGGFIVYRRRTSSRRRQRRRNGGNGVAATASPSSRAHWRKTSVQIPHTPKEDAFVDISSPSMHIKLYDPDDPSTYPPPLSEIIRVPAPTFRPHPLIQSTVLPR